MTLNSIKDNEPMIETNKPYWKEQPNIKYLLWLEELSKVESLDTGETLRDKFENRIVKNESVTDLAEHFIPVVLNTLPESTSIGRAFMFDLLFSLGAGYSNFSEQIFYAEENLERRCRNAVKLGTSQYFYYLEKGTLHEKKYLPDLLELVSRDDGELKHRLIWVLECLLSSESETDLVKEYQSNLEDLREKGSN